MTDNAKSVIEIDLKDTAWKKFQVEFNDYQKALGAGTKRLEELGAVGVAAAGKHQKALEKVKATLADLTKTARDSIHVFERVATLAYDIAKSFASAAFSLTKWLAFGAIASGFGLGALAQGASATRRDAAGAGVSPGEYKAADIYFKQILGDSTGVLSNIARTMNDPASRIAFTSLGINPNGKNPFQLMNEFLVAASAQAKKNPNIPLPVFDSTIGKILSLEQYKALGQAGPKEVAGLAAGAQRSAGGLALGDRTLASWQRFLIMLDLAGNRIENSLINALVKLSGPLGTFANKIADAVDSFSKSGGFQHLLDMLIDGLTRFGNYITSPQFGKDIETFGKALGEVADAMVTLAKFINDTFGTAKSGWNSYREGLDQMNAANGSFLEDLGDMMIGGNSAKPAAATAPAQQMANLPKSVDFLAAQGIQKSNTPEQAAAESMGMRSTLFMSPTINLNVIAPPYLDFSASMAQGAGQ